MDKYILLKDHLKKKAGEEIEVTPIQVDYFRRVGLISDEDIETPKKKAPPKKK